MAREKTSSYSGDIADIIEMCGMDVAREVVDRLGGVVLRIPERVSDDHLLMRLSAPARQSMLDNFQSAERLYIPKAIVEADALKARRERALALRRAGKSPSEIALEMGVTQRTVFLWFEGKAKPSKQDTRQINMFD